MYGQLAIFALLICQCFANEDVIDLTWDFDNQTIYWVNTRHFEFVKVIGNKDDKGYWYASNEFCASEHGGTHFDAPYHFFEEGWKVAEVPLERLIVNACTMDLKKAVEEKGADFEVTPQHFEDWQKENGDFPNGTVLIINFGWSKYWHNRTEYLGISDSKLNFPGLSKAAAEWIVNSKKFYGIGVDTASVDPGKSVNFSAHQLLNGNQLFVLENVKLLVDLPKKDYTLIIAPMKLGKGSGAPLRLLALTKRKLQ